jgi:tRNA A-37 threonylcarbamoyl transferase component Bud32
MKGIDFNMEDKQNITLIQQGAEAKILLNKRENFIIKDRISKSYRIKEIDNKIRKQRTKSEAKLLEKASKIVNSPKPLFIPTRGFCQIKMPCIDGRKLSEHLNNFDLTKQKQIMKLIGESVAKLHKADIIHGDLTTSNMILVDDKEKSLVNDKNNWVNSDNVNNKNDYKCNNKNLSKQKEVIINLSSGWEGGNNLNTNPKDFNFKIFFIDFGLGFISKKTEDKAVDLHLLKQALEAKHFQHWQVLFQEIEKSYEKELGNSEAKKVFERITSVEHRGRYRH